MTAPRNLLERIANTDDRTEALALLTAALGPITPSLVHIHISADWRWAKVSPFTRLAEMGNLLKAEAYELMDLVPARTPMETVGTND